MSAAQLTKRMEQPAPALVSVPRDRRRYPHFRYKTGDRLSPVEFPVEEKVPETPRHRAIRTTLFESAEDGIQGLVSTDQFVYFDPADAGKRLAPDLFVHLGATKGLPDAWKIWVHGFLDVAAEIISPSDARDTPWQAKLERYRQIAIQELYRFDPADPQAPLRVWDWDGEGDVLVERELPDPRCAESPILGLYFVVKEEAQGLTLRLARDAAGSDLLLTPREQKARESERAQKESERADAALEQLRQGLLGVLTARGFSLGDAERTRIAGCADGAALTRYIVRAATASTLAEVFLDG